MLKGLGEMWASVHLHTHTHTHTHTHKLIFVLELAHVTVDAMKSSSTTLRSMKAGIPFSLNQRPED